MSKTILVFIIFIISGFINSCTSSSVAVRPAGVNNLNSKEARANYTNFWEAMGNFYPEYVNTHPASDDEKKYAMAIDDIMRGMWEDSETAFKEIFTDSADYRLKENARTNLINLFYYKSRWKECLSLFENAGSNSVSNDDNPYPLIKEISQDIREEQYIFPDKPERLPVTYASRGNQPMLEISIRGHKKRFIMDTGAAFTVLSSDFAGECGIKPIGDEKIKAGTSTDIKINVQATVIPAIEIGNIIISNHPALIIDKKDLEFKLLGFITFIKIDGVIGLNAIKNFDIEIDKKDRTVLIKKPSRIQNPNRNLFWCGLPLIMLKSEESLPLVFLLDTGANKTFLSGNAVKKLNIKKYHKQEILVGGAGGFQKSDVIVIPDLNLMVDNYELSFRNISTSDHVYAPDGLLGNDIMDNNRIRIDFMNGIFELNTGDR